MPHVVSSCLIPNTRLQLWKEYRNRVVNFFIALPGASIAFVAPTLVSDTLNETSVTPAFRDSLWDVRPHVL